MRIDHLRLGYPELSEKDNAKIEVLFKDQMKATPSAHDAYKAARDLLRGDELDDWSVHLVGAAICIPITEQGRRTVVESPYLDGLLKKYEKEAVAGELWRVTWHGLLSSYFTFNFEKSSTNQGKEGFSKLRALLEKTWPHIDAQSSSGVAVPEWVSTLRHETQILSLNPVEKYAQEFLRGKTESIQSIAHNLGIPSTSWFWQDLVFSAIRHVVSLGDVEFKAQILMLIKLVESAQVYRDKAIVLILDRYFQCADKTVHEELKDYVTQPRVWKNPKLKAAGIATAWNLVDDNVWRMVMNWVNEGNLKGFFAILAERNHSDHGRFKFWSKYIDQISWTRLIIGSDTIHQKNHNDDIRKLLETEEGAYASLTGTGSALDAFMMQIGDYVFVEFSMKGNAAYGYKISNLQFNLNAESYVGGTSDLRYGFYKKGPETIQIIHKPGWEEIAAPMLARLGVYPDRKTKAVFVPRNTLSVDQKQALDAMNIARQSQDASPSPSGEPGHSSKVVPTDTSTPLQIPTFLSSPVELLQSRPLIAAGPNMKMLDLLVSRFPGVSINDMRIKDGGRLWVTETAPNTELTRELKKLGFRWANRRESWYWGED